MSISPLLSTALVDVIPEARLNLVIYYLKQDEINEAYYLIKDLEPTVPQEYILKGVVNAAGGQVINHLIQGWELKSLARDSNHFFEKNFPIAFSSGLQLPGNSQCAGEVFKKKILTHLFFARMQERGSKEHLKIAQQYFQLVGGSASECDTIPGRQCMAACFFLLKQFDDVLLYLNSIKSYYYNDDTFNYNYGQAKAAVGTYVRKDSDKDHLSLFLLPTYVCWLGVPAKILSPILSTAPLQYVPKIRFTPTTIDRLNTDKTKNALHKETVILHYIGGDPISHGLSN